MVNKKIVIAVAIIALIIVFAIILKEIKDFKKVEYTFDDVVENISNTDNNIMSNEIEENDENTIDENTVKDENNTQSENVTNNNENATSTEGKNDEEIAKELAKKKWGEKDDTVYYYVEEQLSETEYVISVRSKSTTAGVMDYKVNIETEEIEEY